MVVTAHIVAQERWSFAEIDDKNVQVTIIVEITEGASAARMGSRNTGSSFLDQFLETAIAQISKNDAGILIRILQERFFHFRVDTPRGHEEVGESIVVEVHDSCSPANVAIFGSHMCGHRGVLKLSLAVVVKEPPGVIREVGLEQVQMPVKIVVAYADAHPRLLHSVIAERHAADYPLFLKRTVPLVHQQKTRRRVTSDENVGPAVFIEVRRDNGHAIGAAKSVNACLNAHIREGSVSVIAVKRMIPRWQAARAAIYGHAFPVAIDILARLRNVCRIKLHVIRNKKIQVAVTVVVHKGATCAPARLGIFQASLFGYVGKRPVAVVPIEFVLSVERAEQVFPPVVVVIAYTDT